MGKGLRRGSIVLGFAGVLVLALPSAFANATPLGNAQTNQHCDATTNGGGFSVVQGSSVGVNYAMPTNGRLTNWSVMAGFAGPNNPDGTETAQLEVWRPTGTTGSYTLVFLSPSQTFSTTAGGQTFTLKPTADVEAGDLLGLAIINSDAGCLQSTSNTSDVAGGTFGPPPAPGTTVNGFVPFSRWQVNVAATLRHRTQRER